MIITDRDRKIINYIEKVRYATTKNIAELFFNNGSKNYYILAINRLKKLVSYGKIKSKPASINKHGRPMTIYFIDGYIDKSNLKHALALANLSAELEKNDVNILSVEPEKYLSKKVRADAIYKVNYNGKNRLFVVEFDITKKFTITKYEYLYKSGEWKDCFKKFPRIVSISNEKPKKSDIVNVIYVKSNLEDIKNLLKGIK